MSLKPFISRQFVQGSVHESGKVSLIFRIFFKESEIRHSLKRGDKSIVRGEGKEQKNLREEKKIHMFGRKIKRMNCEKSY